MALCAKHKTESDAWIDWIGSPSCKKFLASGQLAIHTVNYRVEHILHSLASRSEKAYELVRWQRAEIQEDCTAGKGCQD